MNAHDNLAGLPARFSLLRSELASGLPIYNETGLHPMNETQARAQLKRMYGKKAAWQRNETALVREAREEVAATLPTLKATSEAAAAARDARKIELLKDPEYVRLVEEAKTARGAHELAQSRAFRKRVQVGYVNDAAGLSFFHVDGEGDNWQEAIDAAKAKRATVKS